MAIGAVLITPPHPQLSFTTSFSASRSLGFLRVHVQMRDHPVEQKQKEHTERKAGDGGKKRPSSEIRARFERREQKTEKRRSDHHPGGKARQGALNAALEFPPRKKIRRRIRAPFRETGSRSHLR